MNFLYLISLPPEKMKKLKRLLRGKSRSLAAAIFLLSIVNEASAVPEAPSIERTVTEIQGTGSGPIGENATMTRPHIPVNHTTGDGRVGVDMKPFTGGSRVEFYLYRPESITTPFIDGNAGPGDIMWEGRYDIPQGAFIDLIEDSGVIEHPGVLRHVTIIDKTREFDDDDGTSQINPQSIDGEDVYDLEIFATADWAFQNDAGAGIDDHLKMQITPIRVFVANPKTQNAYIRHIELVPEGTSKKFSADFVNAPRLFEVKFTNDGKLMVARIGIFIATPDPTYYRPDTGALTSVNFLDIVYAYSRTGSLDGDVDDPVDGFDNLIPISWAPYDPRINGQYLNDGLEETIGDFYPFAAFPFRDGSGTIIPPGEDFGGSYPWIDTDGRTLSMSTMGQSLLNGNTDPGDDLYPNTLIDGVTTGDFNEDDGPFLNQSIVGLWTQGKLVTMDNSLNNIDFGLGKNPDQHRILTNFYTPAQEGTGHLLQTDIRVGSGRANDNIQMHGGAGNTTFLDTIENKFNFNDNLRPVIPRDVVWWMSNGKSTAQFAFDDYLNKNSFIISKMNAALEFDPAPNGSGRFFYYDGRDNNADTSIRVANDATAVGDVIAAEAQAINASTPIVARWNIPANGLVTGSDIRLEPIAHGGIEGKGLWLETDARITYSVPAQPAGSSVSGTSWYVGIFVDSRFADDGSERRLISFPDGSSISIMGRQQLRYRRPNGSIESTFSMPDAGTTLAWNRNEWRHLAFQIYAGGQTVEFYHNGFLADTRSLSVEMFQMDAGNLIVGASSGSNGIRGWVDDFKVFAEMFGPEVVANLARGTLVGFNTGDNADMAARAGIYDGTGVENIRDMLYHSGQAAHAFELYAVHHDYTTHDGAHLANLPSGTTSIREEIIFPEAPLFRNVHRPDSVDLDPVTGGLGNPNFTNPFCMSCHDNSNPATGLQLAALELNTSFNTQNDPRRLPTQPLRRVFGHIPANWIDPDGDGVGLPATPVNASAGIIIDDYLLSTQGAGSRTVHTLSLLDASGAVVDSLQGDDIIPYDASLQIRANLDAAQGRVRFTVTDTATTIVTTTVVHETPYIINVPAAGTYDIIAEPFAGNINGIPYTANNVTFNASGIESIFASGFEGPSR